MVSTVGADADPGLLDPIFYSCPGDGGFKIRGETYLKVRSLMPAPFTLFPACLCQAGGVMLAYISPREAGCRPLVLQLIPSSGVVVRMELELQT